MRLAAANAATARITSPWRTSTISFDTDASACIAGAPQVSEGNAPVRPLGSDELKELQRHYVRDGWLPEDEVDGKLGGDTRRATRKAQAKLGLPADGYPTVELLQALNASRG